MKAKEFLKKIMVSFKLDDTKKAALTKAIDDMTDAELGDDLDPTFEATFLTRERAENDPGIVNKIQKGSRSEIFDKVDTKLKGYINLLDDEDKTELAGNFLTYEKLDKIEEKLTAKIARLKEAKTDGSPAEVKTLQKQIQKLEADFNAEKKALETKLQGEKEAMEKELRNANLDFILKSKIFANPFAKEYEEDKEDLANLKIAKLKKDNILTLNQDGTISIQYKDETGAMRDRFDGNDKVTIDKLIQGEIGRYVKKNNGDGGKGSEGKHEKKKIQDDPGDGGETMAQKRARLASTTVAS